MKKFRNKISAVFAVACFICLALSCTLFVACGDKKETYTVSVYSPSGKAVAEADVVFTPAGGGEAVRLKTGEDGTVSVSLSAKKEYVVTLENLPNGFLLALSDWGGVSTESGAEIEFRLAAPETYAFELTGPAGTNLSGISVFCAESLDGVRYEVGKTDENGKLWADLPPIDGYAFITPPEGFVYDENYEENGPYRLYMRNSPRVTFELIQENEIALDEEMTAEEITAFQTETGDGNFKELMENEIHKAYSFTKTDGAAKRVYSFTAQETGEYWFFVKCAGEYSVSVSDSLHLSSPLNSLDQSGSFKNFSVNCEAGKTYRLAAQSAGELQFVILSPKESNETSVSGTGKVQLSVSKRLPAEIKFTPTKAGSYTFATATKGVKIEVFSQTNVLIDSSENGSVVIEVSKGNLVYEDGTPSGAYWTVRFSAESSLEVAVEITREELVEYTSETEIVKVTEQLSQYENQSGTLTQIGVNGTNGQIVKGDDRFYHFGSKDGAVVVIQLKGKISPFYPDKDFEKLDESTPFYRFHVSTDEEKHIRYFENYAQFLRGYLNYGDEKNASGEYYLKYVNQDGVYPLTDELAQFLKFAATANAEFYKNCVNGVCTEDSLWLFSAYYYAQ